MSELECLLSTLEVADMLDIDHWQLLRKLNGRNGTNGKHIKGYVEILRDNQVVVTDFFKESTYKSEQNKKMPCYKVTKKGCEFLANKFAGEKGVIFTARYINRFHEMEDVLSGQTQSVAPVPPDQMQLLSQKQEKLEKELGKMKADMHRFRLDKGGPVFSITCNSRYPYKTMIMSMLGKVDDARDEIFLSQMYTLFKKHMEKVSI